MTSTIKVNNIQNQCGANIINESANTITIGASGDTVTLASGASQTGFGRTGTVDWQTSIKTGDFTATSGEGYFVNTTSGAITVTLPASPSVGDIVAIKDYAQTFDTNNCTVGRNSQPIEGQTFDLTLDTEGQGVTLVYGDATKGWQAVNSNEIVNTTRYVAATGGTIVTCGNFKIHTFTGPGTFTVTCRGTPSGSTTVDYMVVAGGAGGGGAEGGGGGGAGGFRESSGTASGCYSVSPLGACVAALPVSATTYPVTVGAGGSAGPKNCGSGLKGGCGANSVFSTITSTGGGGGGGGNPSTPIQPGNNGGSGGGGGEARPGGTGSGGAGNTPPVSPAQGQPGGAGNPGGGNPAGAGGGGGATDAGTAGPPNAGGDGGDGATTSITASPVTYAGGGGGGVFGPATVGVGGPGGGGNGGRATPCQTQQAGTANTGGGGGGAASSTKCGAAGGSGIVIIRYKFQ